MRPLDTAPDDAAGRAEGACRSAAVGNVLGKRLPGGGPASEPLAALDPCDDPIAADVTKAKRSLSEPAAACASCTAGFWLTGNASAATTDGDALYADRADQAPDAATDGVADEAPDAATDGEADEAPDAATD